MKQFQPFPAGYKFAETLAQRVSQVREFRNLTIEEVADFTHFTVRRVEDIEAGLETWLSTTDRQRLAKALSIEPYLLQEVEKRAAVKSVSKESHMLDQATAAVLSDAILHGARDLSCPDCNSPLKCSVLEGIDLENKPIQFAKAFCTKCPFVLRL